MTGTCAHNLYPYMYPCEPRLPPPKSPRLAHIRKRGLSFELHYPIPTALRSHYLTASGKQKTHIDRALKTRDPDEAYRLKLVELQRIEAEFRALRRADRGARPEDIETAVGLRADINAASNSDNYELAMTLSMVASDYAETIDDAGGNTPESLKRAQNFARIADGAETLRENFEAWMQAGALPQRTQAKYRTAIEEFIAHLGGEPLLTDMNDESALAYVDWLNREGRSQRTKKLVPLSFNSKRDRIMALSAFWNKGLVKRRKVKGPNPWSRLEVTDRPTPSDTRWDSTANTGRALRRPFFDEADMLAILDAPGPRPSSALRYPKATLMEVLCLGLITGARPDEICSLRLEEVRPIAGGYALAFNDPKNDESVRRVPVVHELAVGIIARRIGERTDGAARLFPEFRPKGQGDNYAELVLRALGRHLERATGLTPGAVPYCTRHTFMTTIGAIPGLQRVAWQRYVGHKSEDITSKHYQGITQAQLLEIAQAFHYAPAVEQRMRAELGLSQVAG